MRLFQHLMLPCFDALFGRSVNDLTLRQHAWQHPGAQSLAMRDRCYATASGYPVDEGWMTRHALSPALDRRDDWLLAQGRWHALLDDVVVQGEWPSGPFMALGTHWGAGLPTLAHLASMQRRPCFVYRAEPASVHSGLAERWAHQLHLYALNKAGGVISLGGAYQKITQALQDNQTPVVLIDAPAEDRPTLAGRAGEFTLNVRQGLLNMLCQEQIRFAFYRCGFDPVTGQRQLFIAPSAVETQPQAIADAAAAFLREALALDSAQWRLWMVSEALLAKSSQ